MPGPNQGGCIVGQRAAPELPVNAAPLRLLVADDQPIIRRGLALMLDAEDDIAVVGQAADGQQALELARALRPDVVVMDLQMPRLGGVAATRQLAAELPRVRVVVLTTFDDDELVYEAVRAGAHAYLLKDAAEAEVLETVRAVHRGESRLSPAVARKVLEQFRTLAASARHAGSPPPYPGAAHVPTPPALDEPLSDKEERVLALLADGLSNRQIAERVFLAEGTVKNYVSRIMDKLHARNRIELAVLAQTRRG
ncbi:MAG: response regulator transcription factor [Burkholderiaceae bacterium]|nr:response regulator transcription factor [Pseudomonadota bacterium]MBS0596479.1 response regulator transcription factor [Pseudomonadota bacterium]MCP5216717.1 response regulator transcription factor [Burkholderiaceae bacterium]